MRRDSVLASLEIGTRVSETPAMFLLLVLSEAVRLRSRCCDRECFSRCTCAVADDVSADCIRYLEVSLSGTLVAVWCYIKLEPAQSLSGSGSFAYLLWSELNFSRCAGAIEKAWPCAWNMNHRCATVIRTSGRKMPEAADS